MKITRLLVLFVATVLAADSAATAGVLVDTFAGPPTAPDTTRTDLFAQAGFGFYTTPGGTKRVNRLGFWVSPDDPGGMLAVDHDIALYNFNGANYTQIAAATVPAGSAADANGYAWATIPAVTLTDTRQGADYYIVMASVGTDVWAPFTGNAHAPTIDAGFGTRTNNGWFSAAAAPGVGGAAGFNVPIGNGGYFGPNIGLAVPRTFISDTFAGAPDGPELTGRAPDEVNVPGVSWVQATSQNGVRSTHTAGFGDPLPGAFGQHQNASAIKLDNGAFTAPTILQLSVDLKLQPLGPAVDGPASDGRGLALGFYDSVGSWQFSQNHFTGLVLDAAGNLNLVQDPNDAGFFGAGSTKGTPIAYGGTFDPTQFYTLSYIVDRDSGGILDISLSGSTADYSPFYSTTLFTREATAYGGLYSSSAVAFTFGAFDNFSVAAVPEPSTIVLTVAGGIGLALLGWRVRGKGPEGLRQATRGGRRRAPSAPRSTLFGGRFSSSGRSRMPLSPRT